MIHMGVDPVAFNIGSLDVRWYGIFIALSIVTMALWVCYFGKRAGIRGDLILGSVTVAIPVGLIVSKLLYVIDTSDAGGFLERGGLTVFGGIIGAILGAWIYFRIRRAPFGPLADIAAPGVALAVAVGRIACTLNGCCYGKPTSLPWGFAYTHPDSEARPLNVAVHPTQVYEILLNLALFAVIFWMLRGRLKPAGSLMVAYLALYSIGTFGIRFLRGDTESFLGSLQEAQLVSLIIVAGATFFFVTKTRWVRRKALVSEAGLDDSNP
jgi:phosphatidylglycerol:prolipoprotein diacylglycerol transferase